MDIVVGTLNPEFIQLKCQKCKADGKGSEIIFEWERDQSWLGINIHEIVRRAYSHQEMFHRRKAG